MRKIYKNVSRRLTEIHCCWWHWASVSFWASLVLNWCRKKHLFSADVPWYWLLLRWKEHHKSIQMDTDKFFTSYHSHYKTAQIAKLMGPTWGPPVSCRPQMGPMLAPRTLLSGSDWGIHGTQICTHKSNTYPTLTGEMQQAWRVTCEEFGDQWPCYIPAPHSIFVAWNFENVPQCLAEFVYVECAWAIF